MGRHGSWGPSMRFHMKCMNLEEWEEGSGEEAGLCTTESGRR